MLRLKEMDWARAVGETQLNLVLRAFGKNGRAKWQRDSGSLDQAVYGMEASNVRRGEAIRWPLKLASVRSAFSGKNSAWEIGYRGLWEQGGRVATAIQKRAAGRKPKSLAKPKIAVRRTWQGDMKPATCGCGCNTHSNHDDSANDASVGQFGPGVQESPARRL